MAALDQAAHIFKNLSLDSQAAAFEVPEPTKKIPLNDRSTTPVLSDVDSPFCYVPNVGHRAPYYYGGYDGTVNEFGDGYSRYGNPDRVDMASGVYGDNGSLMYHNGYGFPSYTPYSPAISPVPTLGNDGPLYGAQKYHYSPYFQQLTPTSGTYTPNHAAAPQVELPASGVAKQKPLSVEGIKGKPSGGGFKVNIGATPFKPTYQSGSLGKGGVPGRIPASNYQDPRWGFDGMQSSIPWINGQQRLDLSDSCLEQVNTRQQTERNFRKEKSKLGAIEQMFQVIKHEGWGRLYGGLMSSLVGTDASQRKFLEVRGRPKKCCGTK